MKSGTGVLGMLLALSLLGNAVAFFRLQEVPAPASAPARPAGREAAVSAPQPLRPVETAPVEPRRAAPAPEEYPLPGAAGPVLRSSSPPIALNAVRNDPQVRNVIQAQEEYSAFWKDLDRVFKARGRLDDQKYRETVLNATGEFLGLTASSRVALEDAVRGATTRLGDARRERDAARQTLPPRDKSSPASLSLYEQQKDAIDLRYNQNKTAALDGVRSVLDPGQPRHVEFASSVEKWIANLQPK